jgi:hypothetical protein
MGLLLAAVVGYGFLDPTFREMDLRHDVASAQSVSDGTS